MERGLSTSPAIRSIKGKKSKIVKAYNNNMSIYTID